MLRHVYKRVRLNKLEYFEKLKVRGSKYRSSKILIKQNNQILEKIFGFRFRISNK